jgi:hypothetical protein
MPIFSEMETIGYEQGMSDTLDYVENTIRKSLDNPALDVLTAKQALGILLATIRIREED